MVDLPGTIRSAGYLLSSHNERTFQPLLQLIGKHLEFVLEDYLRYF